MVTQFIDSIDISDFEQTVQHMLSVYNGSNDRLIDEYAGLEESECSDDGMVSFFDLLRSI